MLDKEPHFVPKGAPQDNWVFLIYGDCLEAVIMDTRTFKADDGITYRQFALHPTKTLMEAFGITEDDMKGRAFLLKSYPAHRVFQANNNPNKQRWFTDLNFNGEETGFMRDLLTEKDRLIQLLHTEVNQLKVALAHYDAKIDRMTKYQDKEIQSRIEISKKISLVGAAAEEKNNNSNQEYGDESA